MRTSSFLFILMLVAGCAGATPASSTTTEGEASSSPSANRPVDAALRDEISTRLKATFKNFTYEDVKTTPIPGVYEVIASGRVIYYAPAQDILLFGEMYNTAGHSLTADEIANRQSTAAKKLDESAAIKVGDGPIQVVEFVDPDCGYCKAAHRWMQEQGITKNLTELVYFMPLNGRAEALAKAENVVCAPPALRAAAYDQIWSPTPDPSTRLSCDGAVKQLAAGAAVATNFGVVGTPTYVVQGQSIQGFQKDRLTALLTVTH